MRRIWGERFGWWLLVVWLAVILGGVITGAGWGLGGFDCAEPREIYEGPCPISDDLTPSDLASHALAGAIRLGLAFASLAHFPATVFVLLVLGVVWFLGKRTSAKTELAPQIALAIVALGATTAMLVTGQTASYLWWGQVTFIGAAVLGLHLTPGARNAGNPAR